MPLTVEDEEGNLIAAFKFEDNAGVVYDPSNSDDMVKFAKKLAAGYNDFRVSSESNLLIEELVSTGSDYDVSSEYKFEVIEDIEISDFVIETSSQGNRVEEDGSFTPTVSLSFGTVTLQTKTGNKQPDEPTTEK